MAGRLFGVFVDMEIDASNKYSTVVFAYVMCIYVVVRRTLQSAVLKFVQIVNLKYF